MPGSSASHGICALTAIPVRKNPDLWSEMTTQLLFGEAFSVVDRDLPFLRIRAAWDGYEGWIDGRQSEPLSVPEAASWIDGPFATALEDSWVAVESGHRVRVPLGAHLSALRDGMFLLGSRTLPFRGPVLTPNEEPRLSCLIQHAHRYLGSPYLWGGRSPLGIDCSGLTQVVFKAFGIRLPRDTLQQVAEGDVVTSLKDALPGDLAFFEAGADSGPRHVGLIVPGGIIHASGRVRLDDIDEDGVRERDSGSLTHRLSAVRRMVRFDPSS